MEFAMKIKRARANKELSVQELAEKIGLKSPGYISRIEGRGEIPAPDMIVKLAKALSLDEEELFTMAGEEKGEEAKLVAQKKYENAFALYRKNNKK